MRKIAISYRRDDSKGVAGRIYDTLVRVFGEADVFIDIDNIPYGVDFRKYIADSLQATRVLLVLIGTRWRGQDALGQPRIADPADPVRLEIETGLRLGMTVIPVLIDEARMPAAAELPETLHDFCYLNAAPLDSGRDFHTHMNRLIRSLEPIVSEATRAPTARTATSTTLNPSPVAAPAPQRKPAEVPTQDVIARNDLGARRLLPLRDVAPEPSVARQPTVVREVSVPAAPAVAEIVGSGRRWTIALAGTALTAVLGTVYSWSLFTRPLMAMKQWSNTTTTWTFALAILFLGVGAIVGGRSQDRAGPRTVAIAGVAMWALANILMAVGAVSLGAWWTYLTYGVIGGFGVGMAYVTAVTTVTKWFPDKRGLASGMVVMGFGLGAFVYNQIVSRIGSFAAAAIHAAAYLTTKAAAGTAFNPTQTPLTSADIGAIMSIFIASGVLFAVLGGLCASLLRNPPAGYTVFGAVARAAHSDCNYTPNETLRMPQFYLLWLMLFLNVTAGIIIVSNAVPIYIDLTGAAVAAVAPVYGLLAVFNGLGRFFWGAVSDRTGRNYAYVLIFGIQAVVCFVLRGVHSVVAVGVCFAILLLCYGGGFGTMPSFNADYFGTKFLGQNYGMILTAWGFAGIVGPIIAVKVKDATGSFTNALVPVAIMLLIAAILPFITKKPTAPVRTAFGTA